MAAVNRDTKRAGPVERAAAAVPPPAGRAYRFVVVSLLALSTAALAAIVVMAVLIDIRLQAMDTASLKADIAGVKTETASFHADVTKQMGAMQKSMAETATEVNSATLVLNDIALGLHRSP